MLYGQKLYVYIYTYIYSVARSFEARDCFEARNLLQSMDEPTCNPLWPPVTHDM